jgi:sulfate adenylyltransferase subunit 1
MGRVESGEIARGDEVTVLPSGLRSRVRDIRLLDQSIDRAIAEQSVTLLLADEVDISRGDMIVGSNDVPELKSAIQADICWLSERPLDPNRRYLIRHTTREAKAKLAAVHYRLNIHTMEHEDTLGLNMNDIARVSFRLAQPLAADCYKRNRNIGAFIVIDETSNNTVGAGMIVG